MHKYCHRCGGDLTTGDGESSFCPHCGAPQIYLLEHGEIAISEEVGTTGKVPPPRPRRVEWKTAIRCATLVGGGAALLSLIAARIPEVGLLSWLWIISASITALGLYQWRRPQAWMDAGIGARIGVVVGLVQMSCLALTMTVAGLVVRYGLHGMGSFDAQLTEQLRSQIEHMVVTNPQPPEIVRYFYSSEFRAGVMLAGFAMLGLFVLGLSTLGGAVSGLLRARRSTTV